MHELPIWRIRKAGPTDAEALSLVGSATFLETFAGVIDGAAIMAHCTRLHSPDYYREHMAQGTRAWIAEVEPGYAPVGYAMTCAPELDLAQPGDVELRRIYLLPRFRGSILASALMRAVIGASGGYERLLLGVKQDNNRALAFYAKHGFERIGTRRFDIGGKTYDDFVLARPLRAAADTLISREQA